MTTLSMDATGARLETLTYIGVSRWFLSHRLQIVRPTSARLLAEEDIVHTLEDNAFILGRVSGRPTKHILQAS